jgi:hypothetical protein
MPLFFMARQVIDSDFRSDNGKSLAKKNKDISKHDQLNAE